MNPSCLIVLLLSICLLQAKGQLLTTTSLLHPVDRVPVPGCKNPEKCNSNSDCCGESFCFACPLCDGKLNRPGTCFGPNDALPPCAPPPPCDLICPEKECDSSLDCCGGQVCFKCPSCAAPFLKTKGKCISKKAGHSFVGAANACPKCPIGDGKCVSGSTCPKDKPFCNRCPRCEGRNGLEFNGPGTCGAYIISCAAPPPCDGELFLAAAGP